MDEQESRGQLQWPQVRKYVMVLNLNHFTGYGGSLQAALVGEPVNAVLGPHVPNEDLTSL